MNCAKKNKKTWFSTRHSNHNSIRYANSASVHLLIRPLAHPSDRQSVFYTPSASPMWKQSKGMTKEHQKLEALPLEGSFRDNYQQIASTHLMFITAVNQDISTGPLARSSARALAPFIHSVAIPCWLRWITHSNVLIRLLAHFRAHGRVNDKMSLNDMLLSHYAQSARYDVLTVELGLNRQTVTR